MMSNNKEISACIVAKPADEESYAAPVHKFASILEPSVDNLYLISGENVINHQDSRAAGLKDISIGNGVYTGISYIDFVIVQFHFLFSILEHGREFDIVYFHKGSMAMAIPVLSLKFYSLQTCVIKLSDYYIHRGISEHTFAYDVIVTLLQWLSLRCADAVIVFTESERQKVPNDTTYVSFSNYIDFDQFDIAVPIQKREIEIGFVGRFSEVKGIKEFTVAISEIIKRHPNLRATIVGGGPLEDYVEKAVGDCDRIEFPGWVSHERLPVIYNQMEIMVVPSKSEGLPTTVLEAMGCGVIVVATPVGSIEEVINDGETGFILDETSQDRLEEVLIDILNRDDLTSISAAARQSVRDIYSKSMAIKRFKQINYSLCS